MPGTLHSAKPPVADSASVATRTSRLSPWVETIHKPAFIVFLVAWLMNWVALLLRLDFPREGRWIEGLLPLAAATTTLLALARRLPTQNVFTAAAIIATLSTVVSAISAYSGVPFGPIFYTDRLGDSFVGRVPWTIPLLWVVLIINGRGVARLIMRPWRRTNYYGFWVIGFTCLLVVLFDLGFEPFAVHVKSYWAWLTQLNISWYSTPLANFLAWFTLSLGIVIFSIPWLINKQPVKQPIDYQPLAVWLLINAWVLTGNIQHQHWVAVGISLGGNLAVVIYAVRGARW